MHVHGGLSSIIGGGGGKKISAAARIKMLMKDLNRASQSYGAARKLVPFIEYMDEATLRNIAARTNVGYNLNTLAANELVKRGAEISAIVQAREAAGLPTLPAPAGTNPAAVAAVRSITQQKILNIQKQANINRQYGITWTEAQWANALGVTTLQQNEKDLINASILAANTGYQFAPPPEPVTTPSGYTFPSTQQAGYSQYDYGAPTLMDYGQSYGPAPDYGMRQDQEQEYYNDEYGRSFYDDAPSDAMVEQSYSLFSSQFDNYMGDATPAPVAPAKKEGIDLLPWLLVLAVGTTIMGKV